MNEKLIQSDAEWVLYLSSAQLVVTAGKFSGELVMYHMFLAIGSIGNGCRVSLAVDKCSLRASF